MYYVHVHVVRQKFDKIYASLVPRKKLQLLYPTSVRHLVSNGFVRDPHTKCINLVWYLSQYEIEHANLRKLEDNQFSIMASVYKPIVRCITDNVLMNLYNIIMQGLSFILSNKGKQPSDIIAGVAH